jgi:two-component system OmpR family sensor kinase
MSGPRVRHVRWRDRPARWLATRSLRGQLITGLVALLALACAGVGLVTYLVLSHTLLNQLDYQLQSAGGRYASCMEQKHHEGPPRPRASRSRAATRRRGSAPGRSVPG